MNWCGKEKRKIMKDVKIAVAGTGYVGLSIAMLLSQHNRVTAVDIVPEKVEKTSWLEMVKMNK